MAQASRLFLLKGAKLFAAPSSTVPKRSFSEGAKLFVGGISFRTTDDGLREAFAAHGDVMDSKVILDRETGRSRGFGFVTYYNEEDADTAASKLNGHVLDGRAIRVDRASSRPPPPRPMGGDFGGGSGGFGSSSPETAPDEDWGTIPSLNMDPHPQ